MARYHGWNEVRLEPQKRAETHVPALVNVLLVATGSDGGVGGDAKVDGVDVAERVDIGLEVRERLV